MRISIITIILIFHTVTGRGQNLISNYTFEDGNMNIVCDDWYNGCGEELSVSCDTNFHCRVGFFRQSPSLIPEDVWSLKLTAGWFPDEGLAQTYITGQSGTKIYQLHYAMKSDTFAGHTAYGIGAIGTYSGGQFTSGKMIWDTTSHWKAYTIIDTITTEATDTIAVRLSAGMTEVIPNTAFFDLVELTVIGTLTDVESSEQDEQVNIKIYPNPATDNIAIELPDDKNETYTIDLFNPTGQRIRTINSRQNRTTIPRGHLPSGLYFFQVRNESNGRVIGQGRFVWE